MDIVKAISDFPVILQGALGSALFATILFLGQWLVRIINKKYRNAKRISYFWALIAHDQSSSQHVTGFLFCLYGATHYVILALIFFTISSIIGTILYVFSNIGYVISLYFLFRALMFVPHSNSLGSKEDQVKELKRLSDEFESRAEKK